MPVLRGIVARSRLYADLCDPLRERSNGPLLSLRLLRGDQQAVRIIPASWKLFVYLSLKLCHSIGMALTPEQIEEAMKAIVESGAASYSIGNRSVSKIDISKLYDLQQKVAFDRDRDANGLFRVAKLGRPSK